MSYLSRLMLREEIAALEVELFAAKRTEAPDFALIQDLSARLQQLRAREARLGVEAHARQGGAAPQSPRAV